MGYPHFDLVQQAHSELIAEGQIRRRTDQEEVEQDKGLLTRRAAYYSNIQRDANLGILEKTYGNNSMGYSVDLILHRDGTFWDVATDSGGLAQPSNGGPAGPDPELAQRWVRPTADLAGLEDEGPGQAPTPAPDDQLDEILQTLDRMQETQARDTAAIIARSDLNTERIMDEIHRLTEEFQATAKKVLAVYLANREQPPPVDGGGEGEPPPELLLLLLAKLIEHRPEGGQP